MVLLIDVYFDGINGFIYNPKRSFSIEGLGSLLGHTPQFRDQDARKNPLGHVVQ
jgi:hypothetical protein